MPEVSLTVLIIAAAAALLVGFGAAYLIQNAKLAPLKAERDLAKREQRQAPRCKNAIRSPKLLPMRKHILRSGIRTSATFLRTFMMPTRKKPSLKTRIAT